MTMPFYVPPEQLVKDRADFARKGVSRGRPIVVLQLEVGVLLIGENPSPSLRKIGEIYDRIAFAGVGRFNEFETLRVAGIRYADLKGYSYARTDVTGKSLANAYSQTLGQIFSHEIKPYEVDIVVAEVGDGLSDDKLFRVQFDGTLRDADRFAVLGAGEEAIAERISASLNADMSLDEAVVLATDAIQHVEEKEIDTSEWETGFLERSADRRSFSAIGPRGAAIGTRQLTNLVSCCTLPPCNVASLALRTSTGSPASCAGNVDSHPMRWPAISFVEWCRGDARPMCSSRTDLASISM